ncbi:MAG: VanZ family protein [Erysipelotrichaceae bacterium]|nr:VanZ family protein [Erysipelotrichaceae bacterium]
MKTKTIKKLFGVICYSLMILLILHYFQLELMASYQMDLVERFGSVMLICALLYIGTWLITTKKELLAKRMYMSFQFMFVFYLVLFFTITLIDPQLGRSVSIESRTWTQVKEYFEATANIVPLRMIRIYWYGLQNGMITLADYCMNIVGNFIVAMPFAFFLPMFSKKMKQWIPFSLTIFCFILLIECLQVVTMTGWFDVDDLLLNVSGAILMFGCLKLPGVKTVFNRMTFGAMDYEDKRA